MKNLLILGASGSIGSQTIDLLKNKKIEYNLIGISVGQNTKNIKELLGFFKNIKYVYMKNELEKVNFSKQFLNVNFYSEKDGFEKFILDCNPDITVNALVGFVGVMPSYVCANNGIDLALANKESLVVAGDILIPLLKKNNANLYPIDSEHVAIEKCLGSAGNLNVSKIILTCSGGPFRDKNIEQLRNVTREQALNHPTWKMGNKITIDSATLINKVFEIIEAHYLFNYDYENIGVLIHPQSKIHSLIELDNGKRIMDIGPNDMRIPISYALNNNSDIDIGIYEDIDQSKLELIEPNEFQKSVFVIAKQVLIKKGNLGCILNAANDFAVNLFLNDEISFLKIYEIINFALENAIYIKKPNIQDIILCNNNVKLLLSNKFLKGN